MFNIILTENTTANFVRYQSEIFFLSEGVLQSNESDVPALEFTGDGDNSFYVNGTMLQIGEAAAILGTDADSSDVTIIIGQTGSIFGNTDFFAIDTVGDDHVISNAGYISGGSGIRTTGDNASVYNSGTINSVFTSLSIVYAVDMLGEDGFFNNAGLVSARYGVEMNNSANFINSGTISTQETATRFNNTIFENVNFANSGIIISTNAEAILGGDGSGTFNNTGEITGTIDLALGDDVLQNSGTIIGDVLLGSGTNTLTNSGSGVITGDVTSGSGVDSIVNTGTIAGNVDLGGGNDIFAINGAGVVTGWVAAGAGNDTITGGAGADFIDGGDDNDRLFGRGGDDDMRGGLGSDFMSAGAGDDFVLGDDGADRMFGGGGADTLQGGRDLDTIRGGDGDDEINGGRSADILRGGAGADTFLYQFRQDSTLNLSDRIQDFEVGVDVIDVSATASQLSFVGSAAFSGTGNEVRYEIGGNGRTFVEVDTDANGVADMRILLGTVGALTEDDFIL